MMIFKLVIIRISQDKLIGRRKVRRPDDKTLTLQKC